jgi:inhibitor of cysteine peptidase
MKRRNVLSILLCASMVLALAAGCSAASSAGIGPEGTASPEAAETPAPGSRRVTMAASYEDVFKAIQAASARYNLGYVLAVGTADEMVLDGTAPAGAMPAPEAAKTESARGVDYSKTNVQVEGIDEGDIVKTDGSYIYVLRDNELIIFKADGAATARVSSVKVIRDSIDEPAGNGASDRSAAPPIGRYISEYASDIYIAGDLAVVVAAASSYRPLPAVDGDVSAEIYYGGSRQISKIYVYDIADRTKPALKWELGQDGYVLTTRLSGSTLYMISNHYVYDPREGDNETFIPRLYEGKDAKLVAPGDISIMPVVNTTAYTVICAYDLESGKITANQTVLGGGSNVYMNRETLFLANSITDQTASAPYTDSVYTVIDYTTTSVTDITSFDLTGGGLTLKASGSVPGSLDSQFNMDEYDGSLRVVTTTFSQSWSEYTDKAKGFTNYIWKDPVSANGLYVLDGSLKIIGSVADLAPGERVYSARFNGAIGYFVTFRQVDPLFAVDLSDPTKPTVLSALKIPGFSEYLHVWGEGRLFGLGMSADPETGRTDGMKITMFDTTDPTNVTVKHELKLDSRWSTALYNHKAILIAPDKGLIAFPGDNGYLIYTYSDENGFSIRATISALEWSGDSRGLYIGELAYIVDYNSISVLDMTGFKLLERIKF